MAVKFYAVKKGKVPGVYKTWAECKAMVDGFSGAVYKSFPTMEEALAFADVSGNTYKEKNTDESNNSLSLNNNENIRLNKSIDNKNSNLESNTNDVPYAFVDGSYNIATKVYGYGGFLIHDGIKEILQGAGKDEEMASMRNVAGEILGSMAAIKKALEIGIKELNIYYDYMGIEMWATGAWKRNKTGTIEYYNYINSVKGQIKLNFIKVKGHSGIEGNEEADRLAKAAVGNV